MYCILLQNVFMRMVYFSVNDTGKLGKRVFMPNTLKPNTDQHLISTYNITI